MTDFFSGVFATFVTAPLLAFFAIYFISIKIFGKRKAFLFAADITTFLLLFAVYTLFEVITGKAALSQIIILILITAMLITIFQWRTPTGIILPKVLKNTWRASFLLFLFGYLLLFSYGIVKRIIEVT